MRPPTLLLLLTTTLSLTAQAFPTSLSLPSALASLFHTKRDAPYATTANELTDGTTACRAVTLIYARGTNQAGNIGDASAVGPLFFNNISALIGPTNLAVQGVDYDADVDGYLGNLFGTSEEGVQAMTDLVNLAHTQCPETQIVLSGYSQGGLVVHDTADNIASNAAIVNQVAAVVIFGDPQSADPVGNIPADKVLIVCHDGDLICDGTIFVLPPHLNYQMDAATSAEFVASKVG